MSFSVDHKQASTYELPPMGDYECVIKSASQAQTKNGTPCVAIILAIRTDVSNPQKGGNLYHNLWKRKEPTPADLACGGYSIKQIQIISAAVGLENGKSYDSLDAWCDDLVNRLVLVSVYHETYNGKTNARISRFKSTQHPSYQPPQSSSYNAESFMELPPSDDDDSDVPF